MFWVGMLPTPYHRSREIVGTKTTHTGEGTVQYRTDSLRRYPLLKRNDRNSAGTGKDLFNRIKVTMPNNWNTLRYYGNVANKMVTNLPVSPRRTTSLNHFCRVVLRILDDSSYQHLSTLERPRNGRVNSLALNVGNGRNGNSCGPCWWNTLTITTGEQFWTDKVIPNAGTSDFTGGWYRTSTDPVGIDVTVSNARRSTRFLGNVFPNGTLASFLFSRRTCLLSTHV